MEGAPLGSCGFVGKLHEIDGTDDLAKIFAGDVEIDGGRLNVAVA